MKNGDLHPVSYLTVPCLKGNTFQRFGLFSYAIVILRPEPSFLLISFLFFRLSNFRYTYKCVELGDMKHLVRLL